MSFSSSSLRTAARALFAALFVAVQVGLILTGDQRPEGAFGFRMFPESSTLSYSLSRETDAPLGGTTVVHVPDGEWSAHDRYGVLRHVSWRERVKRDELCAFGRTIHASYTSRAQLARLREALMDVATHTPDDHETRRLLLDVTIHPNGREAETIHLASEPRL